MTDLEAYAKRMYDTRQSRAHCPAWEQLGDVTKSVWLEMAAAELGEFA